MGSQYSMNLMMILNSSKNSNSTASSLIAGAPVITVAMTLTFQTTVFQL